MATEASVRPLPPPRTWAHAPTLSRRRSPLRWVVPALALGDAAALGTAFGLAYLARFTVGLPLLSTPEHDAAFYSSVAFWAVPLWLGLFAAYRLYDPSLLFEGLEEYVRIANACTAGTVAVVIVSFLDRTVVISRGWLVLTWLGAIVAVSFGRFLQRRAVRWLRRRGVWVTPAIIVGTNEEARELANQLLHDPGCGLRVLGFVMTGDERTDDLPGGLALLGSFGELEETVRRTGTREIVAASTALSREQLLDLYRGFGNIADVELRLSSGLFEILTTGVRVRDISGVPLITPQRVRITGIDATLKRAIDYGLACAALLLLWPLLLALALLVKLDSPGPAFHRRRVLGVGGREFDAFKLRTMVVEAERRKRQEPISFPDRRQVLKSLRDPRITRLGRLLRRTSLDELPQLLNVLRGEMSLVGPRMIAPDEAARYGKWQHNLLTVKPGITGPWQVQGRSDIPYEERVRLSMHYIRNYSFWLDLEILLRTVYVVLVGRGAY